MTHQAQLPVDEIARAVSGAVTLVLSKISTHDFGNSDINCSATYGTWWFWWGWFSGLSFQEKKGKQSEVCLLVSVSQKALYCEELSLQKNIIVSHVASSKHKTGKEKLSPKHPLPPPSPTAIGKEEKDASQSHASLCLWLYLDIVTAVREQVESQGGVGGALKQSLLTKFFKK